MKTPAQTIIEQLGGTRFALMTGAKNFAGGDNFLQFSIGSGAVNKANKVKIILTVQDLYVIEFWKIRGIDCKLISKTDPTYAGRLAATFTEQTGFDTRL